VTVEDRIETALLDRAGEVGNEHRGVGEYEIEADLHGLLRRRGYKFTNFSGAGSEDRIIDEAGSRRLDCAASPVGTPICFCIDPRRSKALGGTDARGGSSETIE